MLASLIALGVVCTLLVVALVAVTRLLLDRNAQEQAAWTAERRELLERIQRPELVPTMPVGTFVQPDDEPDDIEKVGTITLPSELEA